LLLFKGQAKPLGKLRFLGRRHLELIAPHASIVVFVELELVHESFLGFPLKSFSRTVPIVLRKRRADFPDAPLVEVWQHHIILQGFRAILNPLDRFFLLHAEVHLDGT